MKFQSEVTGFSLSCGFGAVGVASGSKLSIAKPTPSGNTHVSKAAVNEDDVTVITASQPVLRAQRAEGPEGVFAQLPLFSPADLHGGHA